MQVIHFTEGTTDVLEGSGARRTLYVSLAQGSGDTHVTCLHLRAGASVSGPPANRDCVFLVVYGQVTVTTIEPQCRLCLPPGVGIVIKSGERYSLETDQGAIALAVESEWLKETREAISTPARIMSRPWPGEE
jgi:redox-sensitive bicupin YhaK (pirin superfamily)